MRTSAPANGRSTDSIKQRRELIDVRNELDNVQRKLARTERALESLSRILSLVPDPIEVVSPDYTVLFANRASRLLHDNDRLEGSFYYQTVMGLDEPPQECPIKRAVEDDREAAYTASCENGDVFDVAVTPIVLADGRRAALSMSKPVVLGVAAESKPGDTEESDEVATATAPLPAGDAEEKDLEDACEPTAGNEEEQIQILQRIAELSSLTLDAVLAQVTDGVLLANTNGQPILYNDAFTRLTGFGSPSPEAAVLSDVPSLLSAILFPEGATGTETFDTLTARTKRLETEVVNTEGERTPVEMAISRIPGDSDADTVVLITLRDLCKSHQQKAQLLEAFSSSLVNERIANLMRQVSKHLTPALHTVDILARRGELDHTARQAVSTIEDNLNLCRETVVTALSLVRPPVPTTIDINHLISEVFSKHYLAEELRDDNIEIVQRYDPAMAETVGYRVLLQLALVNIIKHARDMMAGSERNERRLMVLTESTESNITIRITDNGPGMPDDVLKRIFDHRTTSEPLDRGIVGLHFTKEVVARHDGTVDVKSRLGEGTTFEIRLPVRIQQDGNSPETEGPAR